MFFRINLNNSFQILNGLCSDDELAWLDAARHWKDFNTDLYLAAEQEQITVLADKFSTLYPVDTHIKAAKTIENEALSKTILYEATAKKLAVPREEFVQARSWGTRNQGLLRTGIRL